jgi:hypothetical protein
MHIWRREESECRWEREEIPDAGLSLECGHDGRLGITPGVSDRALAAIVPFEESRVWHAALLTRTAGGACLLNGFPPLAAAVLEERDELIVGSQVFYFGAHGVAVKEHFVEGDEPARCPRCKGGITAGDAVMRCPACRAAHHEGALEQTPGEIRRCFSYFGEPCAACGRSAEEVGWSPEEIWE